MIDVSNGENPQDKLVLTIPESSRWRQIEGEEGCLSIPGFGEQVRRGKRVTVHAQNIKGEGFEMTGEDLLGPRFSMRPTTSLASGTSRTSAPASAT